jgi:acetate kinase
LSKGILVLNAGSSSTKFSVFVSDNGDSPRLSCKGQIEGIGIWPRFVAKSPDGELLAQEQWGQEIARTELLAFLLGWIEHHLEGVKLTAAGHRVVHGGRTHAEPILVTDTVLDELEALIPLAPLHQPHNLSAMRALARLYPRLPQVACFDTAFHRSNDKLASMFALPRWLAEEGVQRYGFHGLSYEYIAKRLGALAPDVAAGRVVACHLGNGASMCALRGGRSVATTMGMTALDGLPMGTRAGQLDPGVILYLMREKRMSTDEITALLYHQSGLLGVSGVSSDMRALAASDDPHAKEAIDYFIYRIGRELGSLAAAMGGLDAIVFTGGIGENSAEVRARVLEQAAWLGTAVDPAANAAPQGEISPPGMRCSAWVIPTDEELMIASHTRDVLKAQLADTCEN